MEFKHNYFLINKAKYNKLIILYLTFINFVICIDKTSTNYEYILISAILFPMFITILIILVELNNTIV